MGRWRGWDCEAGRPSWRCHKYGVPPPVAAVQPITVPSNPMLARVGTSTSNDLKLRFVRSPLSVPGTRVATTLNSRKLRTLSTPVFTPPHHSHQSRAPAFGTGGVSSEGRGTVGGSGGGSVAVVVVGGGGGGAALLGALIANPLSRLLILKPITG